MKKVYTNTSCQGHFTRSDFAAIIVAESPEDAASQLNNALKDAGLEQVATPCQMDEVCLSGSYCEILACGEHDR